MGNISNNVIKGRAAQQDYAAKAFLLLPPALREGFESLKPAEASKARSFFTDLVVRQLDGGIQPAAARVRAEDGLKTLLDNLTVLPPAVRSAGLDASDDDIRVLADSAAKDIYFKKRIGWSLAGLIHYAAAEYGIDTKKVFKDKIPEAIEARLQAPKFWRRQLRRIFARAAERYRREAGFVSRKTGLYASDEAVFRRLSQKRRNLAMLQTMIAINELGQEFTLEALSEVSVSNPALRRAELMVRIRGFEEIARLKNHVGEFFTITCPSRMHRMHHFGKPNEKFSGETPSQAQAYLNKVWGRINAELGRLKIKIYGFRVAEPHHDGTPHWHGLVFMEEQHRLAFRRVVAKHACRENREELGLKYLATAKEADAEARRIQSKIREEQGSAPTLAAIRAGLKTEAKFWESKYFKFWKQSPASARVDFEAINWARGSAAGYIAKYIAKNIDGKSQSGEGLGIDYESDALLSMAETAVRVDAWASNHGIRQFQQIGGCPVTIWRELRRINPDASDDLLMLAQQAADMGDWMRFTVLLGGESVSRKNVRLGLYREEAKEPNCYGEIPADRIMGVYEKATGRVEISRVHSWVLKKNGGTAAAWTCVNNSTKMKFDPKSAQKLSSRPAAATLTDLEKTESAEWLIWKHGFSVQNAVGLANAGLSPELENEYQKDMIDMASIEELGYMSRETREKIEAAAKDTAIRGEAARKEQRNYREYIHGIEKLRRPLVSGLTPKEPVFDFAAIKAADEANIRAKTVRYQKPQYDTVESVLKSARAAREASQAMNDKLINRN